MSETMNAPQARSVRKKASGSSFYTAMRLMPRQERDAMFAIYAFCRKVDDIADDGIGTRPERHQKLSRLWIRTAHTAKPCNRVPSGKRNDLECLARATRTANRPPLN